MMHLCGASLSPYFERAALVARIKGAGRDVITLGGMPCEMKSPEHYDFNPTGKIPFLILDGGEAPIIESQVIAEYLDSVLEGPPLMPSDPLGAARVKSICRLIDLYLAPVVERTWANRGFEKEEKLRAVREDLPKAWDYLERYIGGDGYACGTDWTLADAALIPWLFHFEMFVSKFGDWGVGERPRLINWLAHAGSSELATASAERSRESFKLFMEALEGTDRREPA